MSRGFKSEDREGREKRTRTFHEVLCKHETAAAILCVIDGKDVWVPKSQVDDDSDVWEKGGEGKLVVTQWWAEKAGYE